MKLAYRRDACASDGMGAPPFAGRGDDRIGKGADRGRSAAGSGLQRAQVGAAEVVRRLRACRFGVADHGLHYPLPLVRRQTPVINRIVKTHRAFGCLRFKIRSSIARVARARRLRAAQDGNVIGREAKPRNLLII
jgi:hypothetical protein